MPLRRRVSHSRLSSPAAILLATLLTVSRLAFAAEDGAAPPPPGPPGPAAPAPAEAAAEAELEAQIRKSFNELADSDAAVRDAARDALLGMERRHLPVLRRLVERGRPLRPSQAAVLRDIVTHVYLAGDPYETSGTSAFLGVVMDVTAVRDGPPDKPAPDRIDAQRGDVEGVGIDPQFLPPVGIVIVERLPGFAGYRMLRDGDVILAIDGRPDVKFSSSEVFGKAVREGRPGRPIRFVVLRRGRLVKVAVAPDPRPEAADLASVNNTVMSNFRQVRRAKAEAYWREAFGSLVREQVS